MALEYLRQNSISGLECQTSTEPAGNGPEKKKLSKGKLSLLLSSNVIVWAIFAVAFMDIDVFSMNAISAPHLPHKLPVSGIVYNEKCPSAIIEKEVYGIGDVVDGYTIVRISRTEVEFEKNGKKLIRQTQSQ